jgi:hypothetical protein
METDMERVDGPIFDREGMKFDIKVCADIKDANGFFHCHDEDENCKPMHLKHCMECHEIEEDHNWCYACDWR